MGTWVIASIAAIVLVIFGYGFSGRIRACLSKTEVTVPRVLVYGAQKSGKSSFIEALRNKRYTFVKGKTAFPWNASEPVSIIGDGSKGEAIAELWECGDWDTYRKDKDLIVFVVDAAASDGVESAKKELQELMEKPKLFKLPILFLFNKQDLTNTPPSKKIAEALGINILCADRVYGWRKTTPKSLDVIDKALDWILNKPGNRVGLHKKCEKAFLSF